MYCSQCGSQNYSSDNFCSVCGKKLAQQIGEIKNTDSDDFGGTITASNILFVLLFLFIPWPFNFFVANELRRTPKHKSMGKVMLWIFLIETILIFCYLLF